MKKIKKTHRPKFSSVYWKLFIFVFFLPLIIIIVFVQIYNNRSLDIRSRAALGMDCSSSIPNSIVVGPGCRYKSIQRALDAAVQGQTIDVLPGTYNEGIILKNLVNLNLRDGVVIDYIPNNTRGSTLTLINDGGNPVTTSITGQGVLKTTQNRRNETAMVFVMRNRNSNIKLYCKEIAAGNTAIEVKGGSLEVNCNITKFYPNAIGISSVQEDVKSVVFNGNITATNEYEGSAGVSVLIGDHALESVKINGKIVSYNRPAVIYRSSDSSPANTNVEISGEIIKMVSPVDQLSNFRKGPVIDYYGNKGTLTLRDATLRGQEMAINNFKGSSIILDNVKLITTSADGIGIGVNEFAYPTGIKPVIAPVSVNRVSYTNHPNDPRIPITGSLILDPGLN